MDEERRCGTTGIECSSGIGLFPPESRAQFVCNTTRRDPLLKVDNTWSISMFDVWVTVLDAS